jgi:ferredoxin
VIKIYYFSSTGNSLWSAKKIAQSVGEPCELYSIGTEAQKEKIIIEAQAVVLVFPSYAYGLPVIVRRFAKSACFNTSYVASFVTYGSSPGGTLGEMRRILKKKKIKNLFFGRIPAIENYLALFGPPKPKTMEERLDMQEKMSEEAARSVARRGTNRVNTFRPISSFIAWLFSIGVKIFYKQYRVSENCNGCGVCEKICPVGAITMKDSRPVFCDKCEHCQGCIDMCPLRVIKFGRVKFGTPGYRHPKINISEMKR